MKFIADANLGKLTKWLRIMGYDTVFYAGPVDRRFLTKARQEERVVLTRKRDVVKRQFSGRLVVVYSDRVQDQLKEVTDKLSLVPEVDRILSICIKCNERLEEISREKVSGMVPDHVLSRHAEFRTCPGCKGIYWPGTHAENVRRYLRTHIPRHRP